MTAPIADAAVPHLSGQYLVTGGASGLGRAVVEAVRAAGGRVLVLDIQDPPGEVTAFEKVDVSDTAAVEAAVGRLVADYGDLDGIFTAAGVDSCGPMGVVPAAEWERVIGVNLLGTAATIRAALPSLRRRGGRIVTCASTLGMRVAGDASAYCASKSGVVGLTRALTEELKGQVGVTLLVPGGMETAFFDGRDPQYQPGADAKLNRPENVAASVVFALGQPAGCEVRELVVTSSEEASWP